MSSTTEEASSASPPPNDNPLWPAGISPEDVDDLVDEIVKDPDISISGIPDSLERKIYKSTILLTVNTVYQSLSSLHGKDFLNQQIQLVRSKADKGARERALMLMKKDNVDEQLLEEFALRLVESGAMNHLILVPTAVEKQVFKNTLKLVFRILDLLASNLRITICGHDVSISIERSDDGASTTSISQQVAERAMTTSSLTKIDLLALQSYARRMGVVDDDDSTSGDFAPNFAQRMLQAPRREFVARLHACLYALILGILEDVFDNTVLNMFSDNVRFDLVVKSDGADDGGGDKKKSAGAVVPGDDGVGANERSALLGESKESDNTNPKTLLNGSFGIGVGVGFALCAILFSLVVKNN